MKKAFALFIILLLTGAGCGSNSVPPTTSQPPVEPIVDTAPKATSPTTPSTDSNSTTSSSEPTTSPTTKKTYSMEEVKTHNTPQNCWTAIRGKVYDLTSMLGKHPGGDKAIVGLCGIDGTDKFVNKHGGMPNQEKTLDSFEIGTLK